MTAADSLQPATRLDQLEDASFIHTRYSSLQPDTRLDQLEDASFTLGTVVKLTRSNSSWFSPARQESGPSGRRQLHTRYSSKVNQEWQQPILSNPDTRLDHAEDDNCTPGRKTAVKYPVVRAADYLESGHKARQLCDGAVAGGRIELGPPVESSDLYEKVLTTTPVRDT